MNLHRHKFTKRILMNWVNIEKISKDIKGVYAIWNESNVCIYVGKADKSIYSRLRRHYTESHNEYLELWKRSSNRLYFQYLSSDVGDDISKMEKEIIHFFSPIANKLLVKG